MREKSNKLREEIQGSTFKFEVWKNNMLLQFKMFRYLFFMFLGFYLLLVFFATFIFPEQGKIYFALLMQGKGNKEILDHFLRMALYSLSIFILLPLVYWHFSQSGKEMMEEKLKRGASVVDKEEYEKIIKEESYLTIGNLKMPVSAENKHIFIVGRPGSGKTLIIRRVINDLRKRGDKMIIYDFKGDFICKFYDPQRDYILNPVDKRCVKWTIFNDIHTFADLETVCASIVPTEGVKEPFWPLSARDVLYDILLYVYYRGKTNKDVWEIASLSPNDLYLTLDTEKRCRRFKKYLENPSENKTALSILATLQQYVKTFEYLSYVDGDFSVKKWMEEEGDSILFITSYAELRTTLQPVVSLAVDLMAAKLLSMTDNLKRRRFFILDEFGTMQPLTQIVDLLTNSRSKGGSVWIGIQDLGQIEKAYGKEHRATIVNACANMVILGVSDPETAEFLSKKAGEKEVEYADPSLSIGTVDIRDSFSLHLRDKQEKVILPSEFLSLEDRKGFVKFAGYPFVRVDVPIEVYKDVIPALDLADYMRLEKEDEKREEKEDENELMIKIIENYRKLLELEEIEKENLRFARQMVRKQGWLKYMNENAFEEMIEKL